MCALICIGMNTRSGDGHSVESGAHIRRAPARSLLHGCFRGQASGCLLPHAGRSSVCIEPRKGFHDFLLIDRSI
jgi:hypothetical protein